MHDLCDSYTGKDTQAANRSINRTAKSHSSGGAFLAGAAGDGSVTSPQLNSMLGALVRQIGGDRLRRFAVSYVLTGLVWQEPLARLASRSKRGPTMCKSGLFLFIVVRLGLKVSTVAATKAPIITVKGCS